MKLRFHGSTLRLRLSRIDVAELARSGRVEETVTFAPGQSLTYCLESGPEAKLSAAFDGSKIAVRVPQPEARRWMETDQVGIEGSGGTLHILIEKDFECVHRDSTEAAGAFPNPAARRL